MSYTIEYVDRHDHTVHQHLVNPMVFHDKQAALESACVLIKAGFSVLRVRGPRFEMGEKALKLYADAKARRPR